MEPDPVARLLHAAEALAHARLRSTVFRVMRDKYRLREVVWCGECQRQDALNAANHTESCAVGQLLAAVDAVRESAAASSAPAAVFDSIEQLKEIMRRLNIGFEDGVFSAPAEPQPIESDSLPELIERITNLREFKTIAPAEVSETELKSCPFCGGEGTIHEGDQIFWTECHTCNLDLEYQVTREAAIAAWNQRTPAAMIAPAAEVMESDESWEAAEALHRCWPRGTDVDFASAPSGPPERRVVCGRAIAVSGFPGLDTFTCDLERDHGDAWHHDRSVNKIWLAEATQIIFHASGMVETRLLDRPTEFDFSAVTAVPR